MTALRNRPAAPRYPALILSVELLATFLGGVSQRAEAWVYSEHRDITILAVQHLDSDRDLVFQQLWAQARAGAENRLCAAAADSTQGLAPACIDWAAWPAIAGDHSCSSAQMFATARDAPWILGVADVAAQLKVDLARITEAAPRPAEPRTGVSDLRRRFETESVRAARTNALRTGDLRMQRTDPGYATRAGANNAHFLLPRPTTDVTLDDYAALVLRPGSEVSAVGVYSSFHLSALQKASRLAHESLAPADRAALARAVLADEAFALHFLQDLYSAGHIAGTWGTLSQRQGTHDYYNDNGLEVFTWAGGAHSLVLMGDAHMRPEDAEVSARAARRSLEQVLDVAMGREARMPDTPDAPAEPDSFDVCRNNALPVRADDLGPRPEERPLFVDILEDTPVSSLGPGPGEMPRFRSEIGPFVGLTGVRRRALHRRRFAGVSARRRLDRWARSRLASWVWARRSHRRGRRRTGVRGPGPARGLAVDEPLQRLLGAALLGQPERRRSRTLGPVRSRAHAVLHRAVRPVVVIAALSHLTGHVQKHLRGRR